MASRDLVPSRFARATGPTWASAAHMIRFSSPGALPLSPTPGPPTAMTAPGISGDAGKGQWVTRMLLVDDGWIESDSSHSKVARRRRRNVELETWPNVGWAKTNDSFYGSLRQFGTKCEDCTELRHINICLYLVVLQIFNGIFYAFLSIINIPLSRGDNGSFQPGLAVSDGLHVRSAPVNRDI